ncbi:nitroreductase family protein [Candidatus Pacearchaeota archaeon]|nr:nitroreductase family protein [Candidatus Pacearchaeota archaeon]
MDLDEAIKGRRSVRRFLDEEICEEDLKKIIDAGRYAPSGTNTQPWHFIAITNKEVKSKLKEIVDDIYKKEIEYAKRIGDKRFAALVRAFSGYGKLKDAPAYIFVLARPYFHKNFSYMFEKSNRLRRMVDENVTKSVAMSMQNILLKAYEMNYGTCVLDGPLFAEDEIRRVLNFPAEYRLVSAILLGKTDSQPEMPNRKSIEEICQIIR